MSVLDLLPKKKKAPAKARAGRPAPAPVVIQRYEMPLIPSNHPVPPRLAGKLASLRSRVRFIRSSERLAQMFTVAIILISAQMLFDWLVGLPWIVRAVFLGGDIALLYFYSRKYLFPVLRPLNQEACALLVEKQWPKFRGRIIAAVQFSKPRTATHSPELVRLLQQEAETATGVLDFSQIVPGRPLVRRLAMAITVLLLWGCAMVLEAPGSIALLERVFLLPAKVPRKTEVICLTGNKTIPAGDNIVLRAQARGIVPSHGRVTIVDDSGRIQEVTLDPEKDHDDYFSLPIERVEEPFTYTIRLNDGVSDKFRIDVVPRPNVKSIECEQVYPPYTKLDNMKRTVGNLALLAGSKLKIHAIANSKIVKASLKLTGLDQVRPLTITGPDSNDLSTEIDIPATGLTGFALQLTNEAGVTSGDETQYRIDIVPDRPPSITLTYPERLQELYTLKAQVLLAFTASDDYGIAKVDLCYRIVQDQDATVDASGNPVPPPPAKRIQMDLGQGQPLNLKNRYQWKLSDVQPPLTEGTTLEYWMEASDANNVTGPGIGETEHHIIKVVSAADKIAEINQRLLDNLSNLSSLSDEQVKSNDSLGSWLQGKTDAPTSK